MIVYVSIGNSDDKLSQKQWSRFVAMVDTLLRTRAETMHGYWLSESSSQYQNACWCVALELGPAGRADLKDRLADYAREFRQDSITWAQVSEIEFL